MPPPLRMFESEDHLLACCAVSPYCTTFPPFDIERTRPHWHTRRHDAKGDPNACCALEYWPHQLCRAQCIYRWMPKRSRELKSEHTIDMPCGHFAIRLWGGGGGG